ncbi:MAG: electron transport complex subunit E [Deltaproteobacteria bacterium]|nr:electron transport complex subunit E [Deltaproteobacteria bacterium]
MAFFEEFSRELIKGIGKENPTIRLVIGMCPPLAISTSVLNGIGMGLAVIFVLLGSNIIISLLRRYIPSKIRLPIFIGIISTFVTITDLCIEAYFPILHKSLGIFIPLIVVNCIILARAESFASKNPVVLSIADGIGMGIGFSLALILISAVRESLGQGTFAGYSILGEKFDPALVMVMAPGAFFVVGAIIAIFNYMEMKKRWKS